MVRADSQLVTFTHGPITGELTAQAEADAVAKFDLRRGLRLSADARAKIEGSLQATLSSDGEGSSAAATVAASIGASTRLALAAQLDVNGLWAEACAAAEARAQVRGDIKVTGQMLFDALNEDATKLPAGALVPAIALLGECAIRAGVFAEAYFALRARARLMVGGSVIPRDDQDRNAGVTVAFDYGYAYIWGAGISGYLDVDLPDADRVISVVANAVVEEALPLLPANTPALIDSLLRMVVPLAASAAVAVGRALGAPQVAPVDTEPIDGGIVDVVLSELRTAGLDAVLNELLDAGMAKADELVNAALDSIAITDHVRTAGQAALKEATAALERLDSAQSLADALPSIAELCDTLATFAVGQPQVAGFTAAAEKLTLTVSGIGVLRQILGQNPLAEFPAASAARIRSRLNVTGALTVADLVAYITEDIGKLGDAPLTQVQWLADIIQCGASDLVKVLWSLGEDQPDRSGRVELATHLIEGVIDDLTRYLRPWIDSLPDGALRDTLSFIEPLLDVIEHALLPALAATDEKSAARIRDEMDTLLTGLCGAIVVRCMDVVIRPFFGRAKAQLTELADHVDRNDPAFSTFFKAANDVSVVFRISPAIVSASLREVAGVLDLAERSAFDSAVELTRSFVLLPVDSAERRAQLARLADSDDPRITDDQLQHDLLDALFVKSSEFALGMIPPSIRMSTLIAVDQGPVPMATLFTDVVQIGSSTVAAIGDLVRLGTTVDDVIKSLIADGKVTAQELQRLGDALKVLIKDATTVVKAVIQLLKDFTWPIFVTSTGGLGALDVLRRQFDGFFSGADWLVEQVRERLDRLTDGLVEAMIAVAQDVGVLDTGSGDDLGSLGTVVRQRTLGAPGQPGVELLGGAVHVSHAELATMAANAAFANPEVRDHVRTFHTQAVKQAKQAKEAASLLQPRVNEAAAAEASLKAQLASQQRDTGFALGIAIEGPAHDTPTSPITRFEVVVTGASRAFVDGPHPLLRIEVGGWPVAIDPACWYIDTRDQLRGRFVVVADPTLPAPHPFVAEGAVTVPQPPPASGESITTPAPDSSGFASAELEAVHQVALAQVEKAGSADPADFLTHAISLDRPTIVATEDMFLPPILRDPAPKGRRFPAILALDRQELIAASSDAAATALAELPGTAEIAFVSADDIASLGLPSRYSPSALPGGASTATADVTHTIETRARPGFITVTAAVYAVPKDGQTRETTPGRSADPAWFILGGYAPTEIPPPVNAATFVREDGTVPTGLPRGKSAQVGVVLRNTGTTIWTTAEGYRLGAFEPLGSAYQPLPHDVPPGSEVTFTIQIPSPPVEGATFGWRMVQDQQDREWFGDTTPIHRIALLTNNAAFVQQRGVPTKIPRGDKIRAVMTMRNTGTTTWTQDEGYRLGAVGYAFGWQYHDLPARVAPGESIAFGFLLTAPPKTEHFQWRMVQTGVEWFGAASARVDIAPTEPTECAGLRAQIAALKQEIKGLQEELNDAAPQDKHRIAEQIKKAQDRLTKVENRARELQCDP